MGIKIRILKNLTHMTDNRDRFEVEGETVGDCLEAFVRQFPDLEKEIFKGENRLANIVEVFLNGESTYPDELSRPVKNGDEIYIAHVVGGG